MNLVNNLLILSEIFPYFTRGSNIKNKSSIITAVLFGKKFNIQFKNKISYSMPISDHVLSLSLLQVERYAQIFKIKNDKVEISFDNENKFYISLTNLTQEDRRLIPLLAFGISDGAVFLDNDHDTRIKNDNVLKIIQDKKSIIITSEGIKFFLDSIGPDSFIETFVRRIHDNYSRDLQNKIVIDAGASIGDTPLYFASKGATVYAFEMTKRNYDQMIKNLELNPTLSEKITPVNAAVGKDGMLEYSENVSQDNYEGGASFIVNKYGNNSVKRDVPGMTIKTILEKFGISKVGLLKLDCKGCEHHIQKDELKMVDRVKIEYYSYLQSHKLDVLIKLLKESNFEVFLFKHNPKDIGSMQNRGNILAEKLGVNI